MNKTALKIESAAEKPAASSIEVPNRKVRKSEIDTELFELNAAAAHAQAAVQKRDRNPAKLINVGSASVQIFGRGPWTIAWRESAGGPRKRAMRSDFAKARRFAQDKATAIANGEAWRHAIGQNDFASYGRAIELLLPTGESIEVAAANYAQFRAVLAETKMLAADAFKILRSQASRAKIVHKTCPDIFTELKAAKEAGTYGKRSSGSKWRRTLNSQLEPFAQYFQKPLNDVGAGEMETWLNGLAVVGRTRKGYRAAISIMVGYARSKNYLDANWKELDRVPVPVLGRPKKPLCAPDELIKLFLGADDRGIPFIALQAFAGVRHEELNPEDPAKAPLDWREINFEQRIIRIAPETSKTGEERFIEMTDNLFAWLLPHRKQIGPVCTISNTSNYLDRLKKKAGIKSGRGETTNFLRKSWETYSAALKEQKSVSGEAGHSQDVSRRHYVAGTYRGLAKRWFAILPTNAEILQLNFALK